MNGKILIAAFLGILVGVFLGPLANIFKPVASIFVMLLQMILLPYIAISIIHGLGSMTPKAARRLFKKSLFFWLFLWSIMFFVVFLATLMIPKPLSVGPAPLSNISVIDADLIKNILSLIVPENPVGAFVNNIVPAIAVFGIIVGIALMFIEKKEPLMSVLERGGEIIDKIFHWLVVVSPIGVFAYVAVIAGTINLVELRHYQFYIITFISLSLLTLLWFLPTLLSCLTPLSTRESVRMIINVCLVTFLTGITIIAIPFILQTLRRIGQKLPLNPTTIRANTEAVVPISYAFAQIGNTLFLFFIFYVSFYFRYPFDFSEKSLLVLLSIPISIGSSSLSITGVLSLFQEINFSDNVQLLFSQAGPFIMSFLAAVNMAGALTFILFTLFANDGLLQIKWKRLILQRGGALAATAVLSLVISFHLHLNDYYSSYYQNRKISDVIQEPLQSKIYLPGDAIPLPKNPTESVLERVLRTGVLRVGIESMNEIPFYYRINSQLIGFDIAMAYQLARDLNCHLEFVPLDYNQIGKELNEGRYDIAMSAILMTETRITEMSFSDTYSEQNFALIIPLKSKKKFASLAEVQGEKKIILNAEGGYRRALVNFPNAITKEGNFEEQLESGEVDACISSKINAIAWCLNHPDFTVQDYEGQLGKCYFAYPMRSDALTFVRFINNWLQLKIQDKFYQKQYDYWIACKPLNISEQPRWSIIRNVLHWIQ